MGQFFNKFVSYSPSSSEKSSNLSSTNTGKVLSSFVSSSKSLTSISKKDKVKLEQRTQETKNIVWRKNIREKLLKIQNKDSDYYDKIQEIIKNNNQTFQTVDDYITALGDKESFKQVFLKPIYDFDSIIDELKNLENIVQDTTVYGNFNESEIKDIIENMNSNRDDTKINKFNLKFMLTSCLVEKKFLRNLINPLFQYGTFHAAIAIDNVILEWGQESIICPHIDFISLLISINLENKQYHGRLASIINMISTKISSIGDFFYSLRTDCLGYTEIQRLLENELDKVADVCVTYNGYREYHLLNVNCQTFCSSVCAKLGLELQLQGELKTVVEKLKENGELSFEKGDFQFKETIFSSRKQLDDFVKNDVDFNKLEKDEKSLLFSYKNILDHFLQLDKYKNDKKYETTEEATLYWQTIIKEHLKKLAET